MAEPIVSQYDLDVNGILANLDKVANRFEQLDTQIKGIANDPFKQAAQGAGKLEKELSSDVKKVAELDAVTSALTEEIKRLNTELRSQEKNLKAAAAANKSKQHEKDIKALREEIKKLNSEIANTSKKSKDASSVLSKLKGGFMGAFAGFASGGGAGVQGVAGVLGALNPVLGVATGLLGGLATKAFEATAQWQGYEVALKNSLGSQELANKNLSILEQLATSLPVGLNEVTDSFNQLVNRGFKPTKDELSNLSGFAAAQNKTFDQLIQAILDAENGEVERLKEFGIQAKNEGGKVAITFKGITKEFEKGALNSATAFADLARELGSDKLNADKMETLAGRMSNLADQSDAVARKFGQLLLPVFEGLLSITSKVLGAIDDSIAGFTSFDSTLKETSKTAGDTAFPTLKKLFDLFGDDKAEKGRGAWEMFFFSLRAGFEKIAATGELVAAIMTNLANPIAVNTAFQNYRKNLASIDQAIKKFQTTTGSTAGAGDFEYGAGGGAAKPKGPTEAELKQKEKRRSELTDLERKLQEELLKIENEYGKEKIEALKDNELAYIEAKKVYDLAKIDQEEKALLRLKQIVSGARKGNYDRNGKVIADSSAQLSEAEKTPFNFRRDLVNSEAAKDQAKFINDAEKQITNELSNEYQKQLQAAEYKYDELIKLAKKAGVDTLKIEKDKEKALAKIELDNETSKLERQANLNVGGAELDVIQAQIDGRLDLELQARKQMLEIEKMYNEEKIKLIQKYGTEEEKERILPILKANKQIEGDIKDLETKIRSLKFDPDTLLTKLFGKEGTESFKTAAQSIISSISEVYAANEQMVQNRISRIDDEISKKEEQVQKETELNEEGVANNLELRQKELAELKAARERALEDQKRLQRAQLLIDTASQASAMITAASKVFSGFAGIPVVGVGLGIAAVALMLGAFAAAKIKSFQLVNQQAPQFKHGGRHKGKLHSEGGELVEVERDEWTINRKSSIEHDELLDAINKNDRAGIMDYLLTDLLDGTGVSLNQKERKREMAYLSYYQKKLAGKDSDMVAEIRSLREELVEIKKSTSNIPKFSMIPIGDGKLYKEDNKTGSKEINDISAMVKRN